MSFTQMLNIEIIEKKIANVTQKFRGTNFYLFYNDEKKFKAF